jgi:hypothetical protein
MLKVKLKDEAAPVPKFHYLESPSTRQRQEEIHICFTSKRVQYSFDRRVDP